MGKPDLRNDLTICSVSYKSRQCLELNWSLTERLNSTSRFNYKWLIIENTEPTDKDRLAEDRRWDLKPGVHTTRVDEFKGSYQHALALNKALCDIDSHFVLFLDPDFFIVKPNWINDILEYMASNNLDFFGTPYFPTRQVKYRYFPCVQCLFVNNEQVPLEALDFSPLRDEQEVIDKLDIGSLSSLIMFGEKATLEKNTSDRIVMDMARFTATAKLLGPMLKKSPGFFSMRTSRDTGYRIYKHFSSGNFSYECAKPAWRNPLFFASRSRRRILNFMIQAIKQQLMRLIPDDLSVSPKRRDYTTIETFQKFNLPDLASAGWEEYFWKDKPFGFHIRGLFQGKNRISEIELNDIIEEISSNHRDSEIKLKQN